MNKLYTILRSVRGKIWRGLLTLLLITAVIPAIAVEKTQAAAIDASTLLIRGKTAFDSGKFSEAAKYWQLAQHEYKSQGDRSREALSLNYLSLANQELGQWKMADRYIDQSLNLLDKSSTNIRVLAQVLNTQGSLLLAEGRGKEALANWQEAEEIYSKTDDSVGVMGSKINQAQALQQLGLYRRSQKILEGLKTELNQQSDPQLRIIGLRSLGNALQVSGDLSEAQEVLKQSLTLAREIDSSEETSAILFSLGNTAQGLKSYEAAIAFYEQTANKTAIPINKAEAQLNQLSLLSRLDKFQSAQEIIPKIKSNLDGLSPSRRSIYAQVNFGKNLIDLEQKSDRFDEYLPYT